MFQKVEFTKEMQKHLPMWPTFDLACIPKGLVHVQRSFENPITPGIVSAKQIFYFANKTQKC